MAQTAGAAAGSYLTNQPTKDDEPITGGFEYQTPPPTPKAPKPPAMAAMKTSDYAKVREKRKKD